MRRRIRARRRYRSLRKTRNRTYGTRGSVKYRTFPYARRRRYR